MLRHESESFLSLACRLGWHRASGGIELHTERGARHAVFVRGGDVVGFELASGEARAARLGALLRAAGVDARALDALLGAQASRAGELLLGRRVISAGLASAALVEQALGRQTELRLEALSLLAPATLRFDPHAAAPEARVRVRPFSLFAWARARLRAVDGPPALRLLAHKFQGCRLGIGHACADQALLLPVERRLVRALARPRALAELCAEAHAGEEEALALCALLARAGELVVEPREAALPAPRAADRSAAHQVLGVASGAPLTAVRAAFRKLVRELHPDRHAAASSATQRALGVELARVTSAYRELVAG